MNFRGFTFIIAFFGVTVSYAQILDNDHKREPVVIPIEEAPEIDKPLEDKPFEALIPKKKEESPFMRTPEKTIDYWGKSKYVRRKMDFNPNYGEVNDLKREQYEAKKGDQFFGDFFNNGEFVRVYCRDHEAIDGDRISILVNDEVEVHDIFLVGSFTGFNIRLKPGFNKIEFLALNQGESGPNTAEFRVLDEKGNIIKAERWNLATGYKAKVVIIKENTPDSSQN